MSSKGLWFVIGGFWSILFVSVIVLFQAIIDSFGSKTFFIFLMNVYPTCMNKAMSGSFPRQKFHSPLRFPLLLLSSLESFAVLFFLVKQGKFTVLWFALTPPPLKWFQGQNRKTQKPFENCKRHDTTNFGRKWCVLQRWSYWREHLKYVWNVYCDVTNHRRDHHTTETTSNERFPICHGTNYFHFVLTFSLFTSKQLPFLPICFQYLL